jgi:hypothetical protein
MFEIMLTGISAGVSPPSFKMRPDGSEILPPSGQHGPRLRQGGKQRLIQALIAQPSVEAFDERILGRLARRNVVPFHLPLLRPA